MRYTDKWNDCIDYVEINIEELAKDYVILQDTGDMSPDSKLVHLRNKVAEINGVDALPIAMSMVSNACIRRIVNNK